MKKLVKMENPALTIAKAEEGARTLETNPEGRRVRLAVIPGSTGMDWRISAIPAI